MRTYAVVAFVAFAFAAAMLTACGSGGDSPRGGVTVEPLATKVATVQLGGKREAPRPASTPAAAGTATPATGVQESIAPTEAPAAPVATPEAAPGEFAGRWIDVDVTNFVVRLMDGETVVQEIAPVAVGEQVDTGAYLSTQTGLFHVHNKVEALAYDAPYDTYISHWVGFDTEKDNGFHSFLKDAAGNIVDASTGRVSNGCIRTGGAEAIFAFAEIGMPVYVHA